MLLQRSPLTSFLSRCFGLRESSPTYQQEAEQKPMQAQASSPVPSIRPIPRPRQSSTHLPMLSYATCGGNSDPDLSGEIFPSLTRRTIIDGTLLLWFFAISSKSMPLRNSSQICLSSARDQY